MPSTTNQRSHRASIALRQRSEWASKRASVNSCVGRREEVTLRGGELRRTCNSWDQERASAERTQEGHVAETRAPRSWPKLGMGSSHASCGIPGHVRRRRVGLRAWEKHIDGHCHVFEIGNWAEGPRPLAAAGKFMHRNMLQPYGSEGNSKSKSFKAWEISVEHSVVRSHMNNLPCLQTKGTLPIHKKR